MSKGRINDFYIQYEQLTIKFEEQEKLPIFDTFRKKYCSRPYKV